MASPVATSSSDRIASLDALRGLTVLAWLLCVLGAPVLYQLPNSFLATTVADELSPSFWNGVTVNELVLPMFLFVAGASIVPAFQKRRKAGQSNRQLAARIARRVVLLFAIGILCEGGVFQHWPHLRFVGAFQRIAVCYAIVAALHLTTRWRFQAATLVFLLAGYSVVLAFTTAGQSGISDSLEKNAAARVDQLLLPGRTYFSTWDPEGMLTTVPALAIAIAGLLAGQSLTAGSRSQANRSVWLIGIGIIAVNLGFFGDALVAINSYLCSLTFCLIAIGAGSVLLGGFHCELGVRPQSTWLAPVTALGRNSLVFVLATVVLSNANWLAQPAGPRGPFVGSVGWALILFFVVGTTASYLNRRQIYVTA